MKESRYLLGFSCSFIKSGNHAPSNGYHSKGNRNDSVWLYDAGIDITFDGIVAGIVDKRARKVEILLTHLLADASSHSGNEWSLRQDIEQMRTFRSLQKKPVSWKQIPQLAYLAISVECML